MHEILRNVTGDFRHQEARELGLEEKAKCEWMDRRPAQGIREETTEWFSGLSSGIVEDPLAKGLNVY